jgi:hypothetical protein
MEPEKNTSNPAQILVKTLPPNEASVESRDLSEL